MATTAIGPSTLNAVLAALPETGGLTPAQVSEKIDQWSPVTVRHALRQLVEEGRATYSGANTRRLYRKADENGR